MELTLDLDDDLVSSAKGLVEEEGVSLEELIEAGLRHELERLRHRGAPPLPLPPRSASSARNSSYPSTVTPSACASSSFEPASSPAHQLVVDFEDQVARAP